MAPRCGCGSSSVCACLVTSGSPDNISVTGTGSAGNPYVISFLGGGGGGACYTPEMTRAEAMVLRAASGLIVGCPVTITDGPTIGVAGNTSTTAITIEPVSSTEFGLGAQINTTFDNSAWVGQYDIDAIGGGRIIELTDNRGNWVRDSQSNATTVLSAQFPWGFSNVQGNRINNASTGLTLTGWGTAAGTGAQIYNNHIDPGGAGGTVDITGLSGALTVFAGNRIIGSILTVLPSTPNSTGIQDSDIVGQAEVTVAVGGDLIACRVAYGAELNTGAFQMVGVIIDGVFTKTATANNTNTLVNKSFDDFI